MTAPLREAAPPLFHLVNLRGRVVPARSTPFSELLGRVASAIAAPASGVGTHHVVRSRQASRNLRLGMCHTEPVFPGSIHVTRNRDLYSQVAPVSTELMTPNSAPMPPAVVTGSAVAP
ncbi:hypothetical protein GCM10010495_74240 [Kitasatospora herbaricolor]|nr:hypothetical protein GCM10010495_74240 [Kitasatospora herbaricolor]